MTCTVCTYLYWCSGLDSSHEHQEPKQQGYRQVEVDVEQRALVQNLPACTHVHVRTHAAFNYNGQLIYLPYVITNYGCHVRVTKYAKSEIKYRVVYVPLLLVAERSEANNRAVCDLGWRMYIYIYICKCGPGPRGSPRQQCAVVRGSIRLIECPACARSRL